MNDTVPSPHRARQLMELAAAQDNGVTVLGWADDMVVGLPGPVTFTVCPAPDRQEDTVLVLALRVPHPDSMSLSEVVGTQPAAAGEPAPTGYPASLEDPDHELRLEGFSSGETAVVLNGQDLVHIYLDPAAGTVMVTAIPPNRDTAPGQLPHSVFPLSRYPIKAAGA